MTHPSRVAVTQFNTKCEYQLVLSPARIERTIGIQKTHSNAKRCKPEGNRHSQIALVREIERQIRQINSAQMLQRSKPLDAWKRASYIA